MQIHELNTLERDTVETDFLAIDTGFDTAKISAPDLLKPVKEQADNIENYKVNIPIDENNQPDYGDAGQILRTKGNGKTEWSDVGLPTDEQTETAVTKWLNDHPEATTTVQDGSLTEEKFSDALKKKAIKDYVTPEMFGAAGDGITDDSIAIQNALNASLYVKFTTGKTYICSNCQIQSGHDIDLNGATLKTVTDNPIFVSDPGDGLAINRVHIYNGNLAGDSTDATKTHQRLINLACFYSVFEDLRFSNCYNGIFIRSRTNSSSSTVENVFKDLKFNYCYYRSFETDQNGNATDGRINGMFISCPAGSNRAIYIGKGAGWLVDNIHVYGSAAQFVEIRNASHTFINNAYIEGGYTAEGLVVNQIGSVVLSNSVIVANNDNTIMAEFAKNTSSSTLVRLTNISNLTLECNVDQISVASITGSVDEIYVSGLKLNNPFGSIAAPQSSVKITKPIEGVKSGVNSLISGGSLYAPYKLINLSNATSFTFELPIEKTGTRSCIFEVEFWMGNNYTSERSYARIKGYLLYRNSSFSLMTSDKAVTVNISDIAVTNSDNTITVTITTSISSPYGYALIKMFPYVNGY